MLQLMLLLDSCALIDRETIEDSSRNQKISISIFASKVPTALPQEKRLVPALDLYALTHLFIHCIGYLFRVIYAGEGIQIMPISEISSN